MDADRPRKHSRLAQKGTNVNHSHISQAMDMRDSTSDNDIYSREATPYPRKCQKCKPLLFENIRPDISLHHKSREQLIEKIEDFRHKIRNQSIRLRHLDHELYDLQAAKDKVVLELDRVSDREKKQSDRLVAFGLHPDHKANGTSIEKASMGLKESGRPEVHKEDVDAIKDIDISLRICEYSSRLIGNPQTAAKFFKQLREVELAADDLASYYDLAQTVLRPTTTLDVDINVVIAVEMVPKAGDCRYFRVLHPGQYAAWRKGMKMLRGGNYEIIAYLYQTKEAEGAVQTLEQECSILIY